MNPTAPILDFRAQPSYQMGGQVGPGGMPIRPPGAQAGLQQQGTSAGPRPPQVVEALIQEFIRANPQAVQQIQQVIQEAMAAGEITQQDLAMLESLGMTVLNNPNMYPQMRNLLVQRGVFEEAELPAQYDEGLVIAAVLTARIIQSQPQGANMLQGQVPMQQPPMASMATGGPLPSKSPNMDGSIPITAHEGEYVIPAHVVRAKGTEFFDGLVGKYNEGKK
jgi:hypothetical protein